VAHGKLWAYSDPQRRLSKRKKDELDLIRLAEAYPELKTFYPQALLDQLAAGQFLDACGSVRPASGFTAPPPHTPTPVFSSALSTL